MWASFFSAIALAIEGIEPLIFSPINIIKISNHRNLVLLSPEFQGLAIH
jgi:hypothetical protein